MPKDTILKEIKGVIPDIMDANGNFRTIPIGFVGKRNLSNYRLELLKNFIILLRDTKIINRETRMYLFDQYITVKGVNDRLNAEGESDPRFERIPYNTTISKITYDRKDKIEKLFGPEFLRDILLSNDKRKLAKCSENLTLAYKKYSDNKNSYLRDKIALPLSDEPMCNELSDEEFNAFISTILPYLKHHMKSVADGIDEKSIGYFNYILVNPTLSTVDKERLDYLKQLLDDGTDSDEVEVE